VNPTDPQLQIPWPLQISHISQQDSDWPALNFPNSPGPEITSD
jgi:dTDP-4-dehydrorhamnose 3,5-epimerase-like enzyme